MKQKSASLSYQDGATSGARDGSTSTEGTQNAVRGRCCQVKFYGNVIARSGVGVGNANNGILGMAAETLGGSCRNFATFYLAYRISLVQLWKKWPGQVKSLSHDVVRSTASDQTFNETVFYATYGNIMSDLGQKMTTSNLWSTLRRFLSHSRPMTLADPIPPYTGLIADFLFLEALRLNT